MPGPTFLVIDVAGLHMRIEPGPSDMPDVATAEILLEAIRRRAHFEQYMGRAKDGDEVIIHLPERLWDMLVVHIEAKFAEQRADRQAEEAAIPDPDRKAN